LTGYYDLRGFCYTRTPLGVQERAQRVFVAWQGVGTIRTNDPGVNPVFQTTRKFIRMIRLIFRPQDS